MLHYYFLIKMMVKITAGDNSSQERYSENANNYINIINKTVFELCIFYRLSTPFSIIARWSASSMYKRLNIDLPYLLCVDLELKLEVLLFCFTISFLYIFKDIRHY